MKSSSLAVRCSSSSGEQKDSQESNAHLSKSQMIPSDTRIFNKQSLLNEFAEM